MAPSDPKSPAALGFLTVLAHDQLGLTGGYLILNFAGRPLEFHCTAPVKASRAQEILFGPTLEPYLYGEQIGQTLIAKGSVEPAVICTDVELALCVRDYVASPVALVLSESRPPSSLEAPVGKTTWRIDPSHAGGPPLEHFTLGQNHLAVSAKRDPDRREIVERLEALGAFDLSEPFERIREAVEEAHKGSRT